MIAVLLVNRLEPRVAGTGQVPRLLPTCFSMSYWPPSKAYILQVKEHFRWYKRAEGVGFEPTTRLAPRSGFHP
jgi:hypothetical protein